MSDIYETGQKEIAENQQWRMDSMRKANHEKDAIIKQLLDAATYTQSTLMESDKEREFPTSVRKLNDAITATNKYLGGN